jgi:RNA polymerase sigma-70 factor (ECF subfamily)
MAQLADLLKADVVMGAPTLGLRLKGRSAVCEFLASAPALQDRDAFRFVATRANRQPAIAVYRRDERAQPAAYRAVTMVVLTMDGDTAAGIAVFPDPTLMPVFGLPTNI